MNTQQIKELRQLRKEWLDVLKNQEITQEHVDAFNEDVEYVKSWE